MPTYAKNATDTAPAYQAQGQEVAVAWNRVGLASTELTLNASYALVRLPRGAIVHDVTFKTTDMDSSTGLIFSVGVPGDTERYIRRFTGQVAGVTRAGNDAVAAASMIAAVPLAAETQVNLLVQAAATTGVAGTVDIAVFYTCE